MTTLFFFSLSSSPAKEKSKMQDAQASRKRPLLARLAEKQWALTGLALALLVLLLLPSAQIKLGAAQLNGLIGSYTSGGHLWQVSYSSTGTTTWHTIGPDGTAQQGSRQWPATGSGDGFQDSTRLDGTTSGTVTATLTWVPYTGQDNTTDPPSSSVIVTESGNAQYGGGGLGTGSADDGWGDPPPTNQNNASSGVHYEVKDGTSGTITITKSLSANTPPNTTANGHGGFDQIGAFVNASLSVAGDSVTINPGGTTTVSNTLQALVGQQITASVNCPVGTIISYNWAATGSVFKTYIENLASNQKVALSSDNGDYTGQHLFFYDVTTDDKVAVTCYPNVKFPDGNVQNLSLTSQSVTFKKPSTTWLVKEGYIKPFTLPQYPDYQLYGLAADPATASQHPNGEDWNPVDITMPSGFPSAGQCCFTQLVTPNHTQTKSGVVTPVESGPQGLDGTFEYLGYTWTLPGQGAAGDNPSIPTSAAGNANFSSRDQQAASDQFTTYVMFRPAAVGNQGTIWAPLQSYSWSARTTITYDGSRWNIVPAQSYPTSPSAAAIKGADTSDPPQWSRAY